MTHGPQGRERTAWTERQLQRPLQSRETSLDLISVPLIKQQLTADACWGKETLHKAGRAEGQRDERERRLEATRHIHSHPLLPKLRGECPGSFCLAPKGEWVEEG